MDADALIVSLDVGSSSVRTLLFDGAGRQVEGFGLQKSYERIRLPGGGEEIDAAHLRDLCTECLSHIHQELHEAGWKAVAIAVDTFWHSFLGVDEAGQPCLPFLHLFDTRSTPYAEKLGTRVDRHAWHQRSGCVLHASYWPAKLLFLADKHGPQLRQTKLLLSFGEYYFRELFGRPASSSSMLSATGIWNQNENRYDEEIVSRLPIDPGQLLPLNELDEPLCGLRPEYKGKWPDFANLPWFPPLGDGACNNIGSGCTTRDRFALMVGTSGAMRAVVEAATIQVPPGLWCYRVDRRRFVIGGALSNGGDVLTWLRKTLILPETEELDRELAARPPVGHGLTVLPLLAGERSPHWNGATRAIFAGIGQEHTPIDLAQAALESVALTFRQIYQPMVAALGEPKDIVGSGGAFTHLPSWGQMMADAIGHTLLLSGAKEASSRGAALLAFERLGHFRLEDLPIPAANSMRPKRQHAAVYEEQMRDMDTLYRQRYGEAASGSD